MAQITGETFHSKGRRKYKNAPIILVGGDKGGVGKSFLARIAAGLLLKRGSSVHGFDGDSRNPHLARYYQSAADDNSSPITIDRSMLRSVDGWSEMYAKWEFVDPATVTLSI